MALRNVAVRFSADTSEYSAATRKAAADTKNFGDAAQQASRSVQADAQANIAAAVKRREALQGLAAEYKKVGDSAQKGSSEQIAASKLAASAAKRLGDDVHGGAKKAQDSIGGITGALKQLGSTGLSRIPVVGQALSGLEGTASTAALGIAAAGVAIGAVFLKMAIDGIEKFQSQAAEVRKLKAALGSTAEEASGLRNVSVALGIDTDSLSKGMFRLSNNLVKTGGDLAGVHVETVRNADGSANLVKTLDNMRATYLGMHDPQQRNLFLMQAMGKSGLDLRAIMSLNNKEFEEFKNRGTIFHDSDLKSALELGRAQRELGAATDKLQISLGKKLAPALTEIAHAGTEAVGFLDTIDAAWKETEFPAITEAIGNFFSSGDSEGAKASEAAMHRQVGVLKDAGVALSEDETQANELSKEHQKLADVIDATAASISSAYEALGGSAGTLGGKESQLASQFLEAKSAADGLKSGLDALVGIHVSATESAIKFETQVAALTKSFQDNTSSIDITTEAGRKNMGQILQTISAITGQAEAMTREGRTTEEVNAVLGSHIEQLKGVLRAAGLTEDQIQNLVNKYNLVPGSISTKLMTPGLDDARAQVDDYLSKIGRIPGTVETNVVTNYIRGDQQIAAQQPSGSPRARGGFITRPEVSLIGEAGAELILPLTDMRRTSELLSQAGLSAPHAFDRVSPNFGGVDPFNKMTAMPVSGGSGGGGSGPNLVARQGGSVHETNNVVINAPQLDARAAVAELSWHYATRPSPSVRT